MGAQKTSAQRAESAAFLRFKVIIHENNNSIPRRFLPVFLSAGADIHRTKVINRTDIGCVYLNKTTAHLPRADGGLLNHDAFAVIRRAPEKQKERTKYFRSPPLSLSAIK